MKHPCLERAKRYDEDHNPNLRPYWMYKLRVGRGPVRSMEGMIQAITRDCAEILGAFVETKASLILEPSQRMVVTCNTKPARER